MGRNDRPRDVDRNVRSRLRRLEHQIGEDLLRIRIDVGASRAAVARAAGIDRSFYGRIEAGEAVPSLETLVAISTALGADPSIRLYSGAARALTITCRQR